MLNIFDHFRGVGTIDIELTNVDINQCGDSDQNTTTNVFAGTHQCPATTTVGLSLSISLDILMKPFHTIIIITVMRNN